MGSSVGGRRVVSQRELQCFRSWLPRGEAVALRREEKQRL